MFCSIDEPAVASVIDPYHVARLSGVLTYYRRPSTGGAEDQYVYLIWCWSSPCPFCSMICFANGCSTQSVGNVLGIRVVMLDGSQPGLGGLPFRWLMRLVDTAILTGMVTITIAVNGRGSDWASWYGTTVVKLNRKVASRGAIPTHSDDYEVIFFPKRPESLDRDIKIVRRRAQPGRDEGGYFANGRQQSVDSPDHVARRRFLETIVTDHQF
jgi:hypothetical protein